MTPARLQVAVVVQAAVPSHFRIQLRKLIQRAGWPQKSGLVAWCRFKNEFTSNQQANTLNRQRLPVNPSRGKERTPSQALLSPLFGAVVEEGVHGVNDTK
ncbi:MAG: hypothetical protein JWP89_5379 [Schlesneria sp.]|nr:hypothetical protein [Schlesneria sp.]